MRIAWWWIADYSVSDPNTSGMVRTNKVDVLLSAPFADVQEWTRGLEPTNGGTKFPSEVLPPAFTTGRVARVIALRLSPPVPDAWTGICVSETRSIQPTDRSNPSAIMGTDLCTSKSLDSDPANSTDDQHLHGGDGHDGLGALSRVLLSALPSMGNLA